MVFPVDYDTDYSIQQGAELVNQLHLEPSKIQKPEINDVILA